MTTDAATSAPAPDRRRQIAVIAGATLAVVGAVVGIGIAGGQPIDEAAGGALAADATHIAPGSPAFRIWTVIYAGLLAYAIWQLLPSQRTSPRHRALGYSMMGSLLLNAAWILSVQYDLLALTLPIIVALLVVLVIAFFRTLAMPARGLLDAVLTDGTIGLYLGWICVATIANAAAVLRAVGFDGGVPDAWGCALALVAGAVGVLLAIRGRGRLAPSIAICWGLAWVAIARLTGDLSSPVTAVGAIAAAAAVAVVTLIIRARAGWTRGAADRHRVRQDSAELSGVVRA